MGKPIAGQPGKKLSSIVDKNGVATKRWTNGKDAEGQPSPPSVSPVFTRKPSSVNTSSEKNLRVMHNEGVNVACLHMASIVAGEGHRNVEPTVESLENVLGGLDPETPAGKKMKLLVGMRLSGVQTAEHQTLPGSDEKAYLEGISYVYHRAWFAVKQPVDDVSCSCGKYNLKGKALVREAEPLNDMHERTVCGVHRCRCGDVTLPASGATLSDGQSHSFHACG